MVVKKIGKVTLAIILIGAGILLLSERFIQFPVREIFKYWPVMLIGLGLEMMIAAIIYGRNNNVILRYDKTALFAAIIFSFISFGVSSPSINFKSIGSGDFFQLMKFSHQKDEVINRNDISKDIKIEQLVIDSGFGDVNLVPSSNGKLNIKLEATLHYNNEKDAKDNLTQMLQISEGAITRITLLQPGKGAPGAPPKGNALGDLFNRSGLTLTVYIPEDISVKSSNSFGSLEANNLKGTFELNNKNGSTTVENLSGLLSVENSFGSIDISNVTGDTTIKSSNGSIDVSKINGNIKSDASFGSSTIENINGNVVATSGNGEINISDVSGTLTAKNSFGKIQASNIGGDSDITNASGAIELDNVSKNIIITNSFGSILCNSKDLGQSRLDLSSTLGSIKPINGIKPETKGTKASLIHTFGAGTYLIKIINSTGDIMVE